MNTEDIKIPQQKKPLRRAPMISILLGPAAITSTYSLIWEFTQNIEAEKQLAIAIKSMETVVSFEEQLKICQSEKNK